jgi:hypothetical protein
LYDNGDQEHTENAFHDTSSAFDTADIFQNIFSRFGRNSFERSFDYSDFMNPLSTNDIEV